MAVMTEVLSRVYTCCRIVRDRGIYGAAQVMYQILQPQNVTGISLDSMFISETGLVTFADRQSNAELSVNVLHTRIPHFDLHYIVRLLNVSGVPVFQFFSKQYVLALSVRAMQHF